MPKTAQARRKAESVLGDGGQGWALLVSRLADGHRGVLKRPKKTTDETALARMRREGAIIESLSHPYIINILDADLDGDIPWYVTPVGTRFTEWWAEIRASSDAPAVFARALGTILGFAEGLGSFHESGGVHRDVKPDNAVVIDDQPKLIDFGIAFRPEDTERLTSTRRPVANRFAAPPEAYYGPVEAPLPSWDCLGLAWLWGWMLAKERNPKGFQFTGASTK